MMPTSTLPKITVVTPSHNSCGTILETIRSVLDQGYPLLEYIVLDTGADEAHRIISEFSPMLSYWRSHADNGQYSSIEEGFGLATGDILCWLNADDVLLPKSLFVVGEIFSQLPQVSWISTLSPGDLDSSSGIARFRRIPGFSQAAFLDGLYLPGFRRKHYWIQQESTFFRASLWRASGSRFADRNLAGDFRLWCDFFRHEVLYGVEYPLSAFRHREGQRSSALATYLADCQLHLRELRSQTNWGGLGVRRCLYSSIAKLPLLGKQLTASFGYTGWRIKNNNLQSPSRTWSVESYRYKP